MTEQGTVTLEAFPLLVWSSVRQWFEGVRRELALAAMGGDASAVDVRRAIQELLARQAWQLSAPDRGYDQLWSGLEHGLDRIDISYRTRAEASQLASDLELAMVSLDGLCRRGVLLTLPMQPLQRAFVSWYHTEIRSQLAGTGSHPWAGPWQPGS